MSIHKRKLTMLLALPLLSLSATTIASELRYNYAELGTSIAKTQFQVGNQRPTFSGKSFNATVQYTPKDGVYLKGVFSRLSIDDSDTIINTKHTADGTTTTFGGVLGAYRSLTDNVDIRAGIGLVNEKNDYDFSYRLKDKKYIQKSDFDNTRPYIEAGLKVDFAEWGDLDLLLSRYNDGTYFTIGGNMPITETIGIDLGYSYSPSGKDRKRFGAWNIGMRYYF
ncbi:outer membrane beta-barrel protein [Parashewanella tropica]|uniref:outer membrane beta-barrel protein n=1 Tax=Parashewanella tropica TaxID=2547970 RepID=UPI001059F396|nr:outer membrane beta-barrel protein [Parashewanella tropica]